jgi:peptidoglycan/LPS O-acetylase OafA/YrhL
MVQLDGIRAFAVGAVILEHWASGLPRVVREAVDRLDLGGWGVECFFVLSGFLITLILLHARETQPSFRTAIGHFYGRRALRIFPAYYLVLAVAALTWPPMREVGWWHVFYLSNLYPLAHGNFTPAGGHFWSLAVEEQFYLFWPLVVLLAPVRRLAALALLLCALAPVSRLLLWQVMGGVHLSMWTFPTTALDLLAFGAFLAIVKHQRQLQVGDRFVRGIVRAGVGATALYVAAFALAGHDGGFMVIGRSLAAMAFWALVLRASFGFSGAGGWILGNGVVVWIGMISYGLYLMHPFIPGLYLALLSALDLSPAIWGAYYIRFPLLAALLLAVTSASFYLWERPIRSYRRLLT